MAKDITQGLPEVPSELFAGAENDMAAMDAELDAAKAEAAAATATEPEAAPAAVEDPIPSEPVAEPEAPAEPVAETVAEPEAAVEPEPTKQEDIHPKRFAHERKKRREAEDLVAKFEREAAERQQEQPAAAPTATINDASVDKMFDAVMDGQGEAARQEFTDIIQGVIAQTTETVMAQVGKTVAETAPGVVSAEQMQRTMDTVVTNLEATYPILDHDSESFDEGLTARVLAEQRVLIDTEGMSLPDALNQAVGTVLKQHHPELLTEEVATETPAPTQAQVEQRNKTNVQKKVELAASQPPGDSTGDSDRHREPMYDLDTMTIEEYEALPESTIERLRQGDHRKVG
jgi:hypothetical protein